MNRSAQQRKTRIRKRIRQGTDRPRLSVFRSNRYCYAQIFDLSGNAIIGVSEKAIEKQAKGSSIDRAKSVGQMIAKLARAKKITSVVFDKGRFAYHGRVKALAGGAREGGLNF